MRMRKLNDWGCQFWNETYTKQYKNGFYQEEIDIENRLMVPEEIFVQGAMTVAEHLGELFQYGSKYLNEARIILLGEKGAGKTSFARRFVDLNAPLPAEDESTDGVDINFNQNKPVKLSEIVGDRNLNDANVHIWDFAGHVITHAVHGCFLSEDCIYIVLYDGRTDRKEKSH
jgi:GTPase SAR1 family protein